MMPIKNEQDWLDALDECGPFNARRLRWLVFVAEVRGWRDRAEGVRQDMEEAEALYLDAARSVLGCKGVFACK